MSLKENIPWTEKYRPKTINRLLDNENIIKIMKKCLQKNNIPHMIFFGPPGVGKTSAALALCYQLFGPKFIDDRVLELNASDERGIKVVRTTIKNFAKKKLRENHLEKYEFSVPDYKIIILDEADALTQDSQFALRRIIEKYSNTTRFFLICNYISKINTAIISRCAKFRFKMIDEKIIYNCLRNIVDKENIKISKSNIKKIMYYSDGDLRKAITNLQRFTFLTKDNTLLLEDLIIIFDSNKFKKLLEYIKENNTYEDIKLLVDTILRKNYTTQSFIKNFCEQVIISPDINDIQKCLIIQKIANLEYMLNKNCNENIILLNLFLYVVKIYI